TWTLPISPITFHGRARLRPARPPADEVPKPLSRFPCQQLLAPRNRLLLVPFRFRRWPFFFNLGIATRQNTHLRKRFSALHQLFAQLLVPPQCGTMLLREPRTFGRSEL